MYSLKQSNRVFLTEHVLNRDREIYFTRLINYFSKLLRQYIRNIILQEDNKNFNINILSAQIEEGIWGKPKYSILSHLVVEEDIDNMVIDNPISRFNINEANFSEVFNYELINTLYKKQIKTMPWLT